MSRSNPQQESFTTFLKTASQKILMTTFFIETNGDSNTLSNSEQMAGLLQQAKFTSAETLEESDIVILNNASLPGPKESSFFARLEQVKQDNPYKIIIIAGCIPLTEQEKLKPYSIIGTMSIHRIVEVVEEALNNNVIKILESSEKPPLDTPKIRRNPIVEIIPISRGSLNTCKCCKTSASDGNLESYPIDEIVKVAKRAVSQGVKEILLTSEDAFCYGFDMATSLPDLLVELIKIPGEFKIRIGRGSPAPLQKIKEKLFPLLQDEKMFQFLHIPALSGSNRVLSHMQRGNTKEEFLAMVKDLRALVPHITLLTDIMVGYPLEKEDDYWETLNLARAAMPDIMNISRFWPKVKTPAAKLKPVPEEEVQRRLAVVKDIMQNMSKMQNERWLDWEGNILIHEKGTEGQQWIGRNQSYKPIIVEGQYKIGDALLVKIEKAEIILLRGKVLPAAVR